MCALKSSEILKSVHLHLRGEKRQENQRKESQGNSGEAGESKDGRVQEAVGGEEADPCGDDPTVPAAPASHPSQQCEYLSV